MDDSSSSVLTYESDSRIDSAVTGTSVNRLTDFSRCCATCVIKGRPMPCPKSDFRIKKYNKKIIYYAIRAGRGALRPGRWRAGNGWLGWRNTLPASFNSPHNGGSGSNITVGPNDGLTVGPPWWDRAGADSEVMQAGK